MVCLPPLTSHLGTFSLNLRPIPATVPPVPAPHTTMSTWPGGEEGEGREGEGRGGEGRGGEGRGGESVNVWHYWNAK